MSTENVIPFPDDRAPARARLAGRGVASEAVVVDTKAVTYSVDQVAELLGLSRGTAYQHVRDGVIPAVRLGRRWFVPRNRFHAWLDGAEG